MADLSQTAANVKLDQGTVATYTAGEALTQGQPIYQSNGKWYRCDADVEASAECRALVLTPAAADGDLFVAATPGSYVDLGATLVVGECYVVSVNAGGIAPITDLGSGDYVTILGVCSSTSQFYFWPLISGATHA